MQADIQYDTVSVPGAQISGSTDVVQETIVFKNEPVADIVDVGSRSTALAKGMSLPQELGDYLKRPRLIFSYAWAENGANGSKTGFFPWDLFFSDLNMYNKLVGYSMLRANLKLKFLVNGSPFYYGSLLAAYTPLAGYRTDTASALSVGPTLVANSQKPHVWLENQNMSTAEMTLPFLYPYPYLDIGTRQRLQDMGTINLIQYAPLLSANGVGSQFIDVQIYAWAEDVMLSGPTDLPILQSGFVHDKQVSKTASAVAQAAGKLKNVPVLGEYAMATEMAAKTAGAIADFFGFTNVPNVSDVQPFKQVPFSLASTEISEPVTKLSLQAKQETAVGSQQHGGSDCDELAISHFCGRSSFLTGSTWTTTAPPGEALFTTNVHPNMFDRSSTQIAHTPMSYIANHFQWWRGSLRYTFKLVRSPYHRGRLQITWDRLATGLNQGGQLGNPNTYTTVMDLDEDSECSMVIPYMQPQPFSNTYDIADTGSVLWSTSSTPTGTWFRGNGTLSVRVLNRLTAPETSSSATLLVFVNAEPDIQFAGPREYNVYTGNNILSLSSLTTAVTQSDIAYDDADEAHHFTTPSGEGDLYKEVFGERIVSMREYLHRSSVSFVYQHEQTGTEVGVAQNFIPIKRMPPAPGVYNNGWWTGTTTSGAGQRANYVYFHPLVAMSSCFVGYKGSVNVTVNVDQPSIVGGVDTLTVYRLAFGGSLAATSRRPGVAVIQNATLSSAAKARSSLLNTSSGRAGQALTNTKTNAGLSVNLPYYARSGFALCNMYNEYSNQDSLCDNNSDWWNIEWRYNKTNAATTSNGTQTTVYYASGPDFDLVFFVNVPVLTLVSVTPV
jgi:hypothetical protein